MTKKTEKQNTKSDSSNPGNKYQEENAKPESLEKKGINKQPKKVKI